MGGWEAEKEGLRIVGYRVERAEIGRKAMGKTRTEDRSLDYGGWRSRTAIRSSYSVPSMSFLAHVDLPYLLLRRICRTISVSVLGTPLPH